MGSNYFKPKCYHGNGAASHSGKWPVGGEGGGGGGGGIILFI